MLAEIVVGREREGTALQRGPVRLDGLPFGSCAQVLADVGIDRVEIRSGLVGGGRDACDCILARGVAVQHDAHHGAMADHFEYEVVELARVARPGELDARLSYRAVCRLQVEDRQQSGRH